MKNPSTFLTTLALALVIRPEVLAQGEDNKAPKSPQDKIVKKYNLEEVLDAATGNSQFAEGCRQPLNTKQEKEIYNDFRKMVEAAEKPDTLLMICQSVDGAPKWAKSFSSIHDPNVVFAQNPDQMERGERNGIMGHEIGHIVNQDKYHLVAKDISTLRLNIQKIQAAVIARANAGNPVSAYELQRINRAIQTDAQAIDRLIEENQGFEKAADAAGAILESVIRPKSLAVRAVTKALHLPDHGDTSCKIDVKTMASALDTVIGKGPFATESSLTHPSLRGRKFNLRDNEKALAAACHEYFDAKKNKPNKAPPSGRGR